MCQSKLSNAGTSPPHGDSPDVSVIIVSWNTRDMTVACVDTTRQALAGDSCRYELILVDNCSGDNTVNDVSALFPEVKIISNDTNLGFAKAVNQGIRASRGHIVLLLNSDARVPESGFTDLLAVFEQNPRCGIAGPALLEDASGSCIEQSYFTSYPNGWDFLWDVLVGFRLRRKYHSTFPLVKRYNQKRRSIQNFPDINNVAVKALSGAFLLIRKDVFKTTGYFDENFFFYFEDIDFCERTAHEGWDIIYHPGVKAVHHHNFSISKRNDKDDLFFQSFYYYLNKRNKRLVIVVIKSIRRLLSSHTGGKNS